MATIFIEGFDKYGPAYISAAVQTNGGGVPNTLQALAQAAWTPFGVTGTGGNLVVANPGASLNLLGGTSMSFENQENFGSGLSKTLPASYSRLIGGFRFYSPLLCNAGVQFTDTATCQCSIVILATSGLIQVNTGSNPGTQLGLSSASIGANSEHYIEFDITFGASGSYTIWLDGVQILSGSGATRVSSNSSANLYQLCGYNNPIGFTAPIYYDDLYLFDTTTSHNNAVLLSNPVVVTDFPISDNQTQFTNLGNIVGSSATVYSISDASGISGNQICLQRITPNIACTINDIVILPSASGSGGGSTNMIGVLYADSSGVPGSRLSTGTNVLGETAGVPVVLPLSTPTALSVGTYYWIGYMSDSSITLQRQSTSNPMQIGTATFASGAPSTAPSCSPNAYSFVIYGACTGATKNWESQALNPPVGDLSSIDSSTVGATDLYDFPAVPIGVTTIYTVAVSINAKVGTAGVHTFDAVAKSNFTSGNGSNTGISPTVSYGWYDSNFDTDPNTSAPWAPAAVTAAVFGIAVVS